MTNQESIKRYVQYGVPCGSFLTAVLCNDLREALGCADPENREQLFAIVCILWNDVPAACWGSTEKVRHWLGLDQDDRAAIAEAFYSRRTGL